MSWHHRQTATREWANIRQRAFLDQGRRCSECGKAGRLEVHHRKPLSEGGTNDLGNLVVLCRGCHIDIHRPVVGEPALAWQVLVEEVRDGRMVESPHEMA